MSIQQSGSAVRLVCAEARGRYLGVAAARLGVPESKLTVADGQILAPDGRSTSYWELADDALLDRAASGEYQPKPASAYHVVGTSVPRLDLPDKLTGRPRFVHDLSPDGLCYGRIIRPPSRGATLTGLDTTATLALPGVLTVVRDGSFLGVVAEEEEVALGAAGAARRCHLGAAPDPAGPGQPAGLPALGGGRDNRARRTRRPPGQGEGRGVGRGHLCPAVPGARVYGAVECHRPVRRRKGSRLQVWSHTQGIYLLRAELARALGLADDDVTVTHVEGPGCYGHNGADDAAMDAALLAMAVPGLPVQVVWSRADELTWAPFGAAAVVRVAADVDAAGNVLSWQHEIWGNGHSTRPGSTRSVALLANSHRAGGQEIEAAAEPPMARGGGAGRQFRA